MRSLSVCGADLLLSVKTDKSRYDVTNFPRSTTKAAHKPPKSGDLSKTAYLAFAQQENKDATNLSTITTIVTLQIGSYHVGLYLNYVVQLEKNKPSNKL